MPLALSLAVSGQATAQDHPLDSIGKDEIQASVAVLKASGRVDESSRFSLITLHEPRKDEGLNFKTASEFRREAFVVVYPRAANKTSEAIVDLKGKKLLSWRDAPAETPNGRIFPSMLTPQAPSPDHAAPFTSNWLRGCFLTICSKPQSFASDRSSFNF